MTTISRRRFLATAALSLAATRLQAQRGTGSQVTLKLSAEATGPHMPADFVGLSYEVQQLADPSFFAASAVRIAWPPVSSINGISGRPLIDAQTIS